VCVKGINSDDAWYYYHTSSLFRAKDATREVFLKPWQTAKTKRCRRVGGECLFFKHPKRLIKKNDDLTFIPLFVLEHAPLEERGWILSLSRWKR
jgi:hypothetical protein